MALTQIDAPYMYTRKGQRLYVVYTSDNSGNDGFKFGFELTENATGKQYQVFISPDPDGRGIFDMAPLVNLRHQDEYTGSFDLHKDTIDEPIGWGYNEYDIAVTEWWVIDGIFTQNEEANDSIEGIIVTNSYFQPFQGYKPNVMDAPDSCYYSWEVPMNFTGAEDYWLAYSDRTFNTSNWYNSFFSGDDIIYIACRWTDIGHLTFSTSSLLTGNSLLSVKALYFNSAGGLISQEVIPLTANSPLIHVACYPGCDGITVPANCTSYEVYGIASGSSRVSARYIFYNEEAVGNWNQNCNYTPMRLAWVNSRGGWDYWNFQLKSERTTQIERKQYNSVLKTDFDYGFSGSAFQPFRNDTRMLTDRSNINTTSMLITSDWLSDGEFTFLRSLLVSNQVQLITNIGSLDEKPCYQFIPVSIEQSSFAEQKNKDGKLHNITLNLKYSQPYWSH